MSNDLTRWTPAMTQTLLNPEMIEINQDPLGISGRVVFNTSAGCTTSAPNYKPFVQHNLCEDKDIVGTSGTAIGSAVGCAKWCVEAAPVCKYFGVSASPSPWCIRYSACTPRRPDDPDHKNDLSYTVYAMQPGGGTQVPCKQDPEVPNPNMYVVYARPLHDGSVAVGLMNRADQNHTISLDLHMVSVPHGGAVHVRDVWARRDLGVIDSGVISSSVCAYCTAVLKLSLVGGARIDFEPWKT